MIFVKALNATTVGDILDYRGEERSFNETIKKLTAASGGRTVSVGVSELHSVITPPKDT